VLLSNATQIQPLLLSYEQFVLALKLVGLTNNFNCGPDFSDGVGDGFVMDVGDGVGDGFVVDVGVCFAPSVGDEPNTEQELIMQVTMTIHTTATSTHI
jgi:hypothetical protein